MVGLDPATHAEVAQLNVANGKQQVSATADITRFPRVGGRVEPDHDVKRGICARSFSVLADYAARSTTRPVTLPSRSRINAALASGIGTVEVAIGCSLPVCASATSSRSSLGLPT